MTEPRSSGADYRRHRTECPHCGEFAEREEEFDRALIKAIQVDVPQDLHSRLILRQSTPRFQVPKRVFAYAASVLLLIGALITAPMLQRSESVGELVVSHLLAEPERLFSTNRVDDAHVTRVLASVGVTLRGDLGEVRFAERCPDWPGAHLVLVGRKGPVTVFVMPSQHVGTRTTLYHGALTGVLIPMHRGSLAIVGMPGEPLDEYERRVRAAIWTA